MPAMTGQISTSTFTYADSEHPVAKRALINAIELLSGRPRLERAYQALLDKTDGGASFWETAIQAARVQVNLDATRIAAIPKTGPLVFLANHPYGILDGVIMCAIAMRARGDFRILINSALCREPRIMRFMLPVDFNETRAAQRTTIQSKRDAECALAKDIPIIVFPAGGIATARGFFGPVVDLDWKLFAAKLIQTSQASVVPVYFHGHNSALFQCVSQFSLTLRLALIMNECRRMLGACVKVDIGATVPYAQLAAFDGRQALTDHLRALVYATSSTSVNPSNAAST
jgi:putative hemolysin